MPDLFPAEWRDRVRKFSRRIMRFNMKLYGAFAALIAVIIAASGISFFGAERLNYHLERSRLAHQVHGNYLSLSSNTYQLFKQLSDQTLIGDRDRGVGEASLLEAIRTDLNEIRLLIADEVKHVGENEDEGEELVSLAALERKVDSILREYQEINRLRDAGERDAAGARLATLLATDIDIEFNSMIEEAIEEEEEEVAEADAAFSSLALRLEIWTAALVFVAVPTSLLMMYFLTRGFRRGLRELTAGAEAYSEGRLEHRIPALTDNDFDVIGERFNRMASELSTHRADMAKSNEALEKTVKARTAELEVANEQLKETDGARRRLFADISHELRTPLTVIRGEAEIALRGGEKQADEYRTTLSRIVDQAGHTTRLVDDLLFIARSDAGQPRLEMRSVAIVGLIEAVAEDFSNTAAASSIVIRRFYDLDGAVVIGDQGRLRQVFSILFDNAIRYSNGGDEIRIRINASPVGVVIAIEDDGIGIAEDDVDKVFQRFYRGGNAVRHANGSGLGLPVAKAIVEAHKGRIDLESRAGEGVTVKVTLPVENKLRAVS